MPTATRQTTTQRRSRIVATEPVRPVPWAGQTPQQVLHKLRPGKATPLQVLEVLITQFNFQHTARQKSVSHKTRLERARFLHQFFRDLRCKAGFNTAPDPRNLGQRHVHAMVQVWRREHLAPATIQTYLSFLRGLARWLGKPGFVRPPDHYGLALHEYERHGHATDDRSWSAHGIDVEALLARMADFDPRVAASLRLMHVFGMRRKESVTFRPGLHVQPFDATGLSVELRRADLYIWIKGKGGRVRWLPVETAEQRAAIDAARHLASSRDAHMGDPGKDLRRNLRRLDYVLEKFGVTRRAAGTTGHGLRHQHLNDAYHRLAGQASPVRGGQVVDADLDRQARQEVAERAGHSRVRAAGAYLGAHRRDRSKATDRRSC